jgi:hypothetical protein
VTSRPPYSSCTPVFPETGLCHGRHDIRLTGQNCPGGDNFLFFLVPGGDFIALPDHWRTRPRGPPHALVSQAAYNALIGPGSLIKKPPPPTSMDQSNRVLGPGARVLRLIRRLWLACKEKQTIECRHPNRRPSLAVPRWLMQRRWARSKFHYPAVLSQCTQRKCQ